MSEREGSIEAAEFLRHAAFVRRLAARLVTSDAEAEDLVQETFVAALERPPKQRASVRAWLARVLRNRAAMGYRGGGRRAARERDVASKNEEACVADTSELVERTELHRTVLEATMSLPEAYREVLLRRFWHEESAAAMAEHLGLPERTVRTRMRRGLEQLRERLQAEWKSPAVFFGALKTLAESSLPVPLSPPFDPTAATGTPRAVEILTILAMKKLTWLAVATAVALFVFLSSKDPRLPETAVQGATSEVATREELPDRLRSENDAAPERGGEADVSTEGAAGKRSLVAEEATLVELSTSTVEPTAEAPAEKDPLERGWHVIEVEDTFGNPVPGALVQMQWLRTRQEPHIAYAWFGEESSAYTDPEGRARLWFPRWVPTAEKGLLDVEEVHATVRHSEYTTLEVTIADAMVGPTQVVLERGAFLIVSGWIDSPDEVLTDVRAYLDDESGIRQADWIPLADGRPSCSKVEPGSHMIYLTYSTPDGELASELTPFELKTEGTQELHLQLLPPHRLEGMLDPQVPRPVRDGEVSMNLYYHDAGKRLRVHRTRQTRVQSDGSFVFENLPPGKGEMIGICEGWSSTPNVAADAEEGHHNTPGTLQQVDPEALGDAPFVLRMRPTGQITFTVLDPAGQPLPGASVASWPNVHWSLGYSSLFMERQWSATTDASGKATLANLPAEDGLGFRVSHESYRMPLQADTERRDASVDVEPGAFVERTVRLDERE